jgi:hypothetical protein
MLSYSLSPLGRGLGGGQFNQSFITLSLKGEGITCTLRWLCPDDTLRIANHTEADYPVWDRIREESTRSEAAVYGYYKRLYILSL